MQIELPDEYTKNPHLAACFYHGVGSTVRELHAYLATMYIKDETVAMAHGRLFRELHTLEERVDLARTHLQLLCQSTNSGPPTAQHESTWHALESVIRKMMGRDS